MPMAVLMPPPGEAVEVEQLHGRLRGSVVVPPRLDLTAPIADEAVAADEGELHRRGMRSGCCLVGHLRSDLACQRDPLAKPAMNAILHAGREMAS